MFEELENRLELRTVFYSQFQPNLQRKIRIFFQKSHKMTAALQQADKLLPQMTRNEKAQLLQWVASELSGIFPGIEKTPGVCSGEARITRTRIPVWSIVNSWRVGFSDEELLEQFPTLTMVDLGNARNYFRANHAEIDRAIQENDAA